jgi:hypothetical protein
MEVEAGLEGSKSNEANIAPDTSYNNGKRCETLLEGSCDLVC